MKDKEAEKPDQSSFMAEDFKAWSFGWPYLGSLSLSSFHLFVAHKAKVEREMKV